MSYEAWGTPDGNPYPPPRRKVAIHEQHTKPAPCIPARETEGCSVCTRKAPLGWVPMPDDVVIDASTLTESTVECPLWEPRPVTYALRSSE